MSTPTGIEKRLHERADAELRKRVDALFADHKIAIHRLVAGNNYPLSSDSSFEVWIASKKERVDLNSEKILLGVRDAVFDQLKTPNRENTVKAFMEKVDTLGDQLDDLRNEIQD